MILGLNWKMNPNLKDLSSLLDFYSNLKNDSVFETFLSPPSIYLSEFKNIENLKENKIHLGGQNFINKDYGSLTGEISIPMLKDFNCNFVLIGHSERRTILNESDELIAKKIKYALTHNIKIILCIGEDFQAHQNNKTTQILNKQIDSLNLDQQTDFDLITIAYEPIWSIGTSKIPSLEIINETLLEIKKYFKSCFSTNIKTLYGGSVSSKNIKDICSLENVDGVLIGGASLKIEELKYFYNLKF